MKADLGLPLEEAVVRQKLGEFITHVPAHVAEIERLEVSVPHGMKQRKDGHHLAVGHEVRTVPATLAAGVQRMFACFFNSGAKYLQNSSNMQKISINFTSVMGMDVFFFFM